jgi:ABC-2 type transport system ATP-binding protein
MQEVQAICDRVIIINQGVLVADDPIERLQSRLAGEALVTVEFKQKVDQKRLLGIKGVKRVKSLAGNRLQLVSDQQEDVREAIFSFAVTNQLSLIELHKEEVSVEDVFRHLTTK